VQRLLQVHTQQQRVSLYLLHGHRQILQAVLIEPQPAEDARKPAWITDALTVQLAKYPRVVGWLWFNENKENNWLVNSSPAALTAFKDILQ
jgi:hypothetical protein